MEHTYECLLETSILNGWRTKDVIGEDKRLDFSKPFLPESLAQVNGLDFLTPVERLKLNQIRAHEYLCMFQLAEESIVPHLLQQTRLDNWSETGKTRALLNFAGEEAKHIEVFREFKEDFQRGFGSLCEFVGPAKEITRFVMSHKPLGVALMAHHFEHMSLNHYVAAVKDDQDLDPQFKRLLKFHWLEESQHVKIGGLMIAQMVEQAKAKVEGKAEIEQGLADYKAISMFLETVIEKQAHLNIEALAAAGRRVTPKEYAALMKALFIGMRWTYIGSALANPKFLATLEAVKPGISQQLGLG